MITVDRNRDIPPERGKERGGEIEKELYILYIYTIYIYIYPLFHWPLWPFLCLGVSLYFDLFCISTAVKYLSTLALEIIK